MSMDFAAFKNQIVANYDNKKTKNNTNMYLKFSIAILKINL